MQTNYVLYSTGCPKCKILEKKLHDKNLSFEIINDTETMKKLDITSVPVLETKNQERLDFYSAVKFVNSL